MNPAWDNSSIPDQTGRIVVVTGANTGIGAEAARVLANKKAQVIIAVRNLEKGNLAAEKIRAQNDDANVRVMALDLADLSSIQKFADEFNREQESLDLLINNAGVMLPPYSTTKDGFEIQFGTNHLGHFALTGLLIGAMKKTAGSRIVSISSIAHKSGNIQFDDLNWERRKYKSAQAYSDSKIANIHFTHELSKKLASSDEDVRAVAAHPGWTGTDLQRHSGIFTFLNPFFSQEVSMGVLPTLYAAIESSVKSGSYIGPSGFMEIRGYPQEVASTARANDEGIASELWRVSEKLTGVYY